MRRVMALRFCGHGSRRPRCLCRDLGMADRRLRQPVRSARSPSLRAPIWAGPQPQQPEAAVWPDCAQRRFRPFSNRCNRPGDSPGRLVDVRVLVGSAPASLPGGLSRRPGNPGAALSFQVRGAPGVITQTGFCGLWRGGGSKPYGRSGSPYGCENHDGPCARGSMVEMCVSSRFSWTRGPVSHALASDDTPAVNSRARPLPRGTGRVNLSYASV